jgi:Fe-S cluster assembly iron-binding protein IscA
MPLITVDQDAAQALKSLLAEKGGPRPIRIELQFTGCCDPSLGLLADAARESDLVEEVDGLTFVIDPQTQELAGEVRIAYREEEGRQAFVVTSSNTIGEWDGLTSCELRM